MCNVSLLDRFALSLTNHNSIRIHLSTYGNLPSYICNILVENISITVSSINETGRKHLDMQNIWTKNTYMNTTKIK